MRIIKIPLFICIFILTISSINAEKIETNFRSFLEFKAAPTFGDGSHNLWFNGYTISLMMGAQFNNHTLGVTGYFDYLSFSDRPNGTEHFINKETQNGADFGGRITLTGYHTLKNLVDFHWGIGTILLKSTFVYNVDAPTNEQIASSKDVVGITFIFDVKFLIPIQFMDIELINRFDLELYNLDNSKYRGFYIEPNYLGGIRLIIHPLFTWFNLFLDSCVSTWIHTSTREDKSYQTALFVFRVGFSLDLTFPAMIKKTQATYVDAKNYIAEYKKKKENEKEIAMYDPTMLQLLDAGDGDVIIFNNIYFKDKSDELLTKSYPVLDKIAKILLEKENKLYILSGYSEYLGNPLKEFELAQNRAKKIKGYLVKSGLDESIIKIKATGYIYSKEYKSEKIIPKISIEIKDKN